MKKILFFSLLLSFYSITSAQEIDKAEALKMISSSGSTIGLSPEDLNNTIISNAYISKGTEIKLIYLQQSYKGLPVFNQIQVVAFKNGIVGSNTGGRIKDIKSKINNATSTPAVSAQDAVKAALAEKKIIIHSVIAPVSNILPNKIDFGKLGVSYENITAELMWVPVNEAKEVKLAWQVYLVPKGTSDYFLIRVDAINSKILDESNLTVYCDWSEKAGDGSSLSDHRHHAHKIKDEKNNSLLEPLFDVRSDKSILSGPSIVNSASYRVIPFPAESPSHPFGNHALVTNPWDAAPGNATSLKWHSNGTTDFAITRGNNVWAQEDLNANNGTGIPGTSSTSPDPLTFDFTPNFDASPMQTTPASNQQFNITNLFYWNNIIHDITYLYGFDEPAGNFQANNQGRGGLGNDFVMADAQDGNFVAPNQNNANFATPADGGSGRMQMYLWDSASRFRVNAPSAIAGIYQAIEGRMSTANKLINIGPVTGDVVYYNDDIAGTTHEACAAPANSLSGKIALIMRGNCTFAIKVKNAQDAGAIGVIMINNIAGLPNIMSGDDNTITIPAMMVSDITGALFIAQLGNGLNVTLNAAVNRDGDVDNGVMVHEYTHGISNRLTGGPALATCVQNAEHMGEGWGDYYALMLTQDWANSNVNTGFTNPRGIATYALGQPTDGLGLRSKKYSTDFSVNNLVYTAALPGAGLQHTRGELWCAALWDMTWNIIQQTNTITPNIYNATATGGNVIALRLVMEGMKLQPCGPGFIDGRNAILQADQLLYGGLYSCSIKEAFRRRGMGPNALQGSANNVNDQVPDFTSALTLKVTQNVTQIPEGQNIVYTNTISTCSPVSGYVLTDTLPANVTYVSGGTYTAATRVVSFPVTLTAGQTQSYSFTVTVNNATYFATTTLFDEPVAAATMPATLTPTSTTTNVWSVSSAQSHSAPNSLFSIESDILSEQLLTTTNGLALGANPAQLSFWHNYNTEAGFDGGIIEISTNNGTSWSDLGQKMYLNRYNSVIDISAATPVVGRQAFSGTSNGFIKTSVNLSAYANQTAKFRWRFNTDAGTGGAGWFVDDINVKSEPLVFMRSNLFTNTGTRTAYSDTVTLILQASVCTNIAVTTAPSAVTACTGSNATFTVISTGTSPSYQWQVSTNGGTSYTNISGATSATLTISSVTASLNNNLYRVVITNACPSSVTTTGVLLTVTEPANIITHPANVTMCTPGNAQFSVSATGTGLTYQWQVSTNGGVSFTNITGATVNTLTVTGVTIAMNNNQYRVVITSCSPTALNSNAATLLVNSSVSITTQPSNTSACTGTNTSISVTAAGSTLSYQWQVSTNGGTTFTAIPGATSATLNLNAVSSAMNGNVYNVIISNSCGSPVTSSNAVLTVTDPASITLQPVPVITCAGNNAVFSTTATGTNITYQWQVSTDGGTNFTNITGATSSTLTLTSVTAAMNNNQYRVVIFSCNPAGLNSTAVLLTVNSSPSITTQPLAITACTGNNAVFNVVASGTGATYQWQVSTDGGTVYTDLAGATSATLNLSAVTLSMNNNRYRVIISGTCAPGVTSSGAILTVSNSAAISTQPVNVIICNGSNAIFTAAASGVSYQWQMSTNGGTSFTDISGATTTTLTLTGVTASMNNNQYRLVVFSCTPGGLNSNAATLTVNAVTAITSQPSNSTVCNGGNASFTVTATGTAASYQWQISTNGGTTYTDIAGATTSALNVNAVTMAMTGNLYRAIISNTCPSTVTSIGALLTVNAASVITSHPENAVACSGSPVTFTAMASGAGLTYQWEVSTNGGTVFTQLTGETNPTLTIASVTNNMNGNIYRVVAGGCGAVNSNSASLTVNTLPSVILSASPFTSIYPDISTTITAVSTPAATSYAWFKNGNLITGASANSLVVDYAGTGIGNYTARVTDANGCSNLSAILEIKDSVLHSNLIYPNPSNGLFNVRFMGSGSGNQKRFIIVFDSKGSRVYAKTYQIASPSELMPVDIRNAGAGIYMVEVLDENGNRIAKGKALVN